jgi:WD40 repeat protein
MNSAESRVVIEYYGHTNTVTDVDWNPEGNRLVSGSTDDTIRVWDTETASVLITLIDTSDVYQVFWNPDGTKIASINAENIVKIWDVSNLPDVSDIPTVTPLPTLMSTAMVTPLPNE